MEGTLAKAREEAKDLEEAARKLRGELEEAPRGARPGEASARDLISTLQDQLAHALRDARLAKTLFAEVPRLPGNSRLPSCADP